MNVVKKIDDIGRITIPRDLRRGLRWMDGDEIEIIDNNDGTLLLRKRSDNTATALRELQKEWIDDSSISQRFTELIELIESKTE